MSDQPNRRRSLADSTFISSWTTTLLASIATVVALFYLIHDRRDQADIAAWTLLQGYLQQEHRAPYNVGQDFAFETLAQHGVSINNLDAHDAYISWANLHDLVGPLAIFTRARLVQIDLSNADLRSANFEGAWVLESKCRGADFSWANFRGARLWCDFQDANFHRANLRRAYLDGDIRGANFYQADISELSILPRLSNGDVFKDSCYRPGHPPYIQHAKIDPPVDPQGKDCIRQWGKEWAALEAQ
ncbi:pentapeptide repeat protein [Paraburkholderia atlantica]|uniref:Pentapeptide repeat protein n=1 Tax=Paraburkholderia atlantica TaxID=2654982 RepID=D5WA26_PARAM|nr:pentapeptide repeat-containing protein [Paraburkholderia atlantica]ADG14248.1 pentapeptide repeat protein [Paraburkholderia atlantica]